MSSKVALRKRADDRSLAQRRADFEAQMKQMAIDDLDAVSKRLKGLHRELERVDGRKWKQYELAAAMKIPPRTFDSWENGEVENSDGKGYEKIARFYSRKLGRKITRRWIVFGDGEEAPEAPARSPGESESEVEQRLGEILANQTELHEKMDALLAAQANQRRRAANDD